ncbi:MAG: class I SAM-dependent methyltransferase [Acidimicrobiales bacterium]|nr:class I SAM-dependent methyltransferase [Acidimicrobiales bacterium]
MYQRFSVAAPAGDDLPTDALSYGADVPREDVLKLLGHVEGKRILDLGCGAGHNAIALARQGAKVIGIDESSDQVAAARAACQREGIKVELHHAPLAELAFLRADSIEGAVSAFGLAPVEDLDRVFRQVDRVLRPEMPLVLSLPHPAFAVLDPEDPERRVQRSYWDGAPVAANGEEGPTDVPRTISALFTSLSRANFRIDTILEPEPPARGRRSPRWTDAMRYLPATLIIRARKQGI